MMYSMEQSCQLHRHQETAAMASKGGVPGYA
jgi:hypothetical protein